MPQRTFSPRTFMGDRGISLDNFGRVLKNEALSIFDTDEKILAPKPWKPSHTRSFSNNSKFVDENLFEEAGQEIQTIILHSFNIPDESDFISNTPSIHHQHHHQRQHSLNNQNRSLIENYTQDSLIELKIPVFSHSPCFSSEPLELVTVTPPTRTHNPITLNHAFSSTDNNDVYQQGAEIGLLSISPPLPFKF
eukprot:gene1507-1899_t